MAADETLTEDQRELLERFLTDAADEGALSYPETAGFLFAVAAAPEPVSGPDWMPFVLGEAAFDDEQQGKAVNRALRALLAWIDEQAIAGESPMPSGLDPAHAPADNIGEQSPLGQWSRGFRASMAGTRMARPGSGLPRGTLWGRGAGLELFQLAPGGRGLLPTGRRQGKRGIHGRPHAETPAPGARYLLRPGPGDPRGACRGRRRPAPSRSGRQRLALKHRHAPGLIRPAW